jgi:hypothetical protein
LDGPGSTHACPLAYVLVIFSFGVFFRPWIDMEVVGFIYSASKRPSGRTVEIVGAGLAGSLSDDLDPHEAR